MGIRHAFCIGLLALAASWLHAADPVMIDYEVREAQRRLTLLGYLPGPADGIMGAKTRQALRFFQADHQLATTGMVDAATAAQLRVSDPGKDGNPEAAAVRKLQTALWKAGFSPGGIDGLVGRQTWTALQSLLIDTGHYSGRADGVSGPQTRAAISRLQRTHKIAVTGTIDLATATAIESYAVDQAASTAP